MERPIGVDLFARAGGLSLGFEQAGFDIAASVEIDPIHAAVHKFNFPYCPTIARSVVGLSGDEIRRISGIGARKIDVVFGGPPCQGFSLIGHRALDDDRNELVREFIRLVNELDATYFVFENVRGLTIGRHRRFLDELIDEFNKIGYEICQPWSVLNAVDFGVPQKRQRLFLLGANKGFSLPAYPKPIKNRVTCSDALADLPDASDFPQLFGSDEIEVKSFGAAGPYSELMRCSNEDAWYFGYKRAWDANKMTSSALTQHSKISQRRFVETPPGTIEPISRFFKLSPDGQCNTLRAGTDGARGAFTSPRPIHYQFPRCITVREMARLHGFPDWFRFHVTKWHGARQVGNSVPPPMARAVATSILKAIGLKVGRPKKIITLAEEKLVRCSMLQAAGYFGVSAPILRRDRKSGAKKRSQAEIEQARLAAE
jgi:DNA (cytosine-5)-methyltransferase 1